MRANKRKELIEKINLSPSFKMNGKEYLIIEATLYDELADSIN